LPPGFRLELVASEPLIREPSGVCWDEHGQLFVSELHGYNLEGQYDIEELNRTGQLDRVVRRIEANERHKKAAEADTYGTIKRLSDTDGDGRMDHGDVWADRLPPCLGICAARGGIIAACQTQVLFLADRDGDGKAEVREVLFDGFAKGPLERSINCAQWGPDNWIYIGRGAGGGTIRGKYLTKAVELPATDFRIQPDGSAIEPVTGGTHTMGFAFTESGDRFVVSTRTPGIFVAPIPWHYLARNPDAAAPPLEELATDDEKVYPASQAHPWRLRRADDPGFSKYYSDRYGIQESSPNGYFTSACSPLVYQDTALPGLRGQLLACEPAQNLVHRSVIQRNGLRLKLQRAPGEETAEFLTSSDPWFHAIALSHGPDGTIWIVDFYREIIEDYSAIPRYLQQQYGLVNGKDHGRIWRLTHAESPTGTQDPVPCTAGVGRLTVEQLGCEVSSPRYWRRETARRLLIEQRHREVVPLLRRIYSNAKEPVAVSNALYTLDGLDALVPADVEFALGHSDPSVRRFGLRFAERWFERESKLVDKALNLIADEAPMVRLQSALSLGETRDTRVLPALASLAATSGDDPWFAAAIVSSTSSTGDQLIAQLLSLRRRDQRLSASSLSMLGTLASVVGSRRDDAGIGRLLEIIASPELQPRQSESISDEAGVRLLDGLIAGLNRRKAEPLRSAAGRRAIQLLLSSDSPDLRRRSLQVAGLLRLSESPAMKDAWNAAVATAMDPDESIGERLSAMGLLSAAPYAESSRLKTLLDPREPIEVQLAVVQTLSVATDPQLVQDLLVDFAKLSPAVQTAAIDAICTRQDRLPKLLDMIERKVVGPSDLPALRRVQLLEHSSAELRARAARLLSSATSADRRDVLERYEAALKLPRSAGRGKQVFEKQCAKCHQLGTLGFAVGPDLDSVRTRPDESLLVDILDPSGTINPGFRAYTVSNLDGRVFTGLLANESATSITLRREQNESDTILRKEIAEMRASSKSLMPDGIEKEVMPQDVADLLAFLRESLGPPVSPSLVLFDDEREFLDKLSDGDGTATLTTGDKFSGNAALHLTTGQRHSARIAGWQYPIVEKPGRGEFRYLRFAWKSTGAGVMLELAAAGAWPPAHQPARRYFSGKNTTPWQATQISPDAPADWTAVTVDLWKDFGDFTLTGIAPTAMRGAALFDRIELLCSLE
jgi:putative membrane-bound dehydrogenase-like protein